MKTKPARTKGHPLVALDRGDRWGPRSRRARVGIDQILVPIDFSDCSRKALRYAVAFAEERQTDITLLYVVPTTTYAYGEYGEVGYGSIQAEMRQSGREMLGKLRAQEIPEGIRCHIKVKSGSAGHIIPQVAKSMAADLIVISTHGFSGLKHVLMGSVAERVVRYAPCPVLVVREHEHEFIKN
jgi:universal stress protein A